MKTQLEPPARILVGVVFVAMCLVVAHSLPFSVSFASGTMALVQIALRVGVAYWLFQETKKKSKTPWGWCLLGLAFGIMAVAVFLLVEIRTKVSRL